MTILGTIAAIVIVLLISIFLGPYGILVLIAVTFGLALSTHIKNKEIYADIQRIKEKLGIEDNKDFKMSNEEIEKELEQYVTIDHDRNQPKELNEKCEEGVDMNEKYIITSNLIKIRRTQIEDLEYVLKTEQDNENKSFITQWTFEQHKAAMNNRDCLHLVVEDQSGKLVGYSIIFGLENKNETVELMRIAISEKGKGYGKNLLRLLQQYIFGDLQAHRMWLDVREHNDRAKGLYEQVGFQFEGKLRECIKTADGYQSLIIMGLLKEEYEGLIKEGILHQE